MKQRIPSFLFTLSLVILLVFSLFLTSSFLISGVARLWEKEDRLIVDTFSMRYELSSVDLIIRHSYTNVVYILFSSQTQRLYFVDVEGYLLASTEIMSFPKNMEELLIQLNLDDSDVQYGYDDGPVYVLETPKRLIHVRFDGVITLDYRKGMR